MGPTQNDKTSVTHKYSRSLQKNPQTAEKQTLELQMF